MIDNKISVVFFDLGDTLGTPVLSPPPIHIVGFNAFSYTASVLKRQKSHGMRLGVISNTGDDDGQSVSDTLQSAGLLPFFDQSLLIYSKDVGLTKESPAIFALAAERAGLQTDARSCLYVGEDVTERAVALDAGWSVCPHPLLVDEIHDGQSLHNVRITVPVAGLDTNWCATLRARPIVPLHRTGLNGRTLYAITSRRVVADLMDMQFEVELLGAPDLPLRSDLYLLRDDFSKATGFLSPIGGVARLFANEDDARMVLRSTEEGVLIALPPNRSLEEFHFDHARHGHTLKLLADPSLLDPFRGGEGDWPIASAPEYSANVLTDGATEEFAKIVSATLVDRAERYGGQRPVTPNAANRIVSRNIHHTANHQAVAAVSNDLTVAGQGKLTVRLHRFTHAGKTLYNVEAELAGASTELVLITAHLDSTAAFSEAYDAERDAAPGVDDDASGMSAVVSIAERFAALARSAPPSRTVRFVLFNAEEEGLVGSKVYARSQMQMNVPIVAVFQMDMIGYNRVPPRTWEVHIGYSPSADVENRSLVLAELLESCSAKASPGLELPQIYTTSTPGGDPAEGRSDHSPFHACGYAACAVSEDFFVGPAPDSTAPEANPNYHKKEDTFIDGEFAAGIARVVATAAWGIATSPHFQTRAFDLINRHKETSKMASGMYRISFHPDTVVGVLPMALRPQSVRAAASPPNFAETESFEAASRRCLDALFSAPTQAGFNAVADTHIDSPPTLENTGLKESFLTDTVVSDFRQSHRGVPIYGARVGVELTKSKDLVGVTGNLAAPPNIEPIALLSPMEALRSVKSVAGVSEYDRIDGIDAPQLMFWINARSTQWHLVYVFDNIPLAEKECCGNKESSTASDTHSHDESARNFYRLFIDANTGEEVHRFPVRKSIATVGLDADGTQHTIEVSQTGPQRYALFDETRRIRTYSMDYSDIDCGPRSLPGELVTSESLQFEHPSAVIAHANAARVFDFYLNVCRLNSIDGQGMELNSIVDCTAYRHNGFACTPIQPGKKDWKNAAWVRDTRPQMPSILRKGVMVYGQTYWADGKLHSFAESLDVVAHELTHGVTDYTCNLEYATESGALNESYSDILGIAISNAHIPGISQWDWRLGEELSANGKPTRDLQNPSALGQPEHMRDFIRLAPGEKPHPTRNDNGYVHANSGIHNKAAYNLFTKLEFSWQEVVQLYFLTLTTPGRLTAVSTFSDSLSGMLGSCRSLFRADANLAQKLAAIEQAFNDVGITR